MEPSQPSDSPAGSTSRSCGPGAYLLVAGAAAAIQAIYLYEASGGPAFSVPLIDSGVYHDAAVRFASGERIIDDAFWQPPLFPALLGCLYKLTGPSVATARVCLAAVAIGSCLLVQLLTRRLFGSRPALVAGLIAAMYGPFVFFSTELLPVGMGVFLDLTAILLWVRCLDAPSWRRWLALGFIVGLATLTVPNAGVLLPISIVSAVAAARRDASRRALGFGCLIAVGFALAVGPVTVRNRLVSGEWVAISTNGGMNFFVGNNPDARSTVAIRPGEAWRRLARQAVAEGAETRTQQNAYFFHRGLAFLTGNVTGFVRGLARKTRELINGRELPRNLDVYVHRDDSTLISLLLWRVGPFAFPFGLLLPFAIVGMVAALREDGVKPAVRAGRLALRAFVIVYGASVVLFFVSARYRLPMAVAMIPFAATGMTKLRHLMRAGSTPIRPPRLGVSLIMFVAAAVAAAWPIQAATDGFNFRAEAAMCLGHAALTRKRFDDAEHWFRRALALSPKYVAAAAPLGDLLAMRGETEQAEPLLRAAVGWDASATEARSSLADLLTLHGRFEEAEAVDRAILEIDATSPSAHASLARRRAARGDLTTAIGHYRVAVRFAEEPGPYLVELADALAKTGAFAEAIDAYRRALWRVEPDAELLNRVAWLLATCPKVELRDCRRAIELAERVCRMTEYRHAIALDTLAAAYAECGRWNDAVTRAREALRLAANNSEAGDAIRGRLRIYEARRASMRPEKPNGP